MGSPPSDDQLIRRLTQWLMQSGWVKDYEHARAEAESFAADAAAPGWATLDDDSLARALMHAGFSPHRWFNAELIEPRLVHTRSYTDAAKALAGALGTDWIAAANATRAGMATLLGPCVMCGAKPGEPCIVISDDPAAGLRPGDPRPSPHAYRSRDPNEPQPAVAIKDEPPYYLDSQENRERYERERHQTPAERGW